MRARASSIGRATSTFASAMRNRKAVSRSALGRWDSRATSSEVGRVPPVPREGSRAHTTSDHAARELSDWQEGLRVAVAEGGPRAGVALHLGGRAGDEDRERAEAAHTAFYADVAGLASLPVTRGALRAIAQPVVVVTGPASSPATVEAADALAGLVPRARRALDGDAAGAAGSLLGGMAAP